MKITKYEHACWDVAEGQSRVVIDPGIFSVSLKNFTGIAAVVVTHVHSDHFDPDKLNKIISASPGARVFAPRQVAAAWLETTVPEIGQTYQVGDMALEFLGGQHHLFDEVENLAVVVGGKFFCPGDSYAQPARPVAVAAVPASAPWLRIDEATDNVRSVPAATVTPTHDALLSAIGQSIHYRLLGEAAKQAGKNWRVLATGENLEV